MASIVNGYVPGVGCRILTENNHFIGVSEPIHQRAGGIDELRGENIFEGTSGNTAGHVGVAPYAQRCHMPRDARASDALEHGARTLPQPRVSHGLARVGQRRTNRQKNALERA